MTDAADDGYLHVRLTDVFRLGVTTTNVKPELVLLCQNYWAMGPDGEFLHAVADIAAGAGVKVTQVAGVLAAFSTAYFIDELCEDCGALQPISSRSAYVERRRARWTPPAPWTCDECRREAKEHAAQVVAAAKAHRHQLLLDKLQEFRTAGNLVALTLREAVFLCSLVRAGGSEDLSYIKPVDSLAAPLSPSPEFDRRILDSLFQAKVLAVHPGSREDSVTVDGETANWRYFPLRVHWTLPMSLSSEHSAARYMELLEQMVAGRDGWPQGWQNDAPDLHREVALEECLEYFRLSMADHRLELEVGDKTLAALRAALAHFSIGQVYNFIWRAARDAAAFFVRKGVSRAHAGNVAANAFRQYAERAAAEGWDVKTYRRDRRLPESHVSHVLFTTALGLPDGGMGTVPPRVASPDAGS